MTSNKFYAIVAGVGPGLGRSAAVRFSKAYPVVLLSRHPESYNPVIAEINEAGGKAIGISADAGDQSSVAAAFETIKKELPDLKLAAAVYNVRPGTGRPSLKPFLELTLEDLDRSLNGSMYVYPELLYSCYVVSDQAFFSTGFFNFAQKVVPLLLESVESSPHPPTLVLSGATASLRGSVRWAAAAAGKSGQRILNQSLAREFGPRGVHVAHVIIDGGIDIPGRENIQFNNGAPDSKISPEAVSEPDHGLMIWSIDFVPDCRQLLVSAYAAQIGFYP